MIYFDNAATGGKKPDNVVAAVHSSLKICANPGRSGHALSLAHAERVFKARIAIDKFFDGYGYERVAFTKNCTEALNIAIFGLLQAGDHVVTTAMEHNSVLRPLEQLKKNGTISYSVCPLTKGNVAPKRILDYLQPHTKAVIVTSASNVTGAQPPLEQIRELLPKHILLIVDGAQGGGHFPISMQKIGIDALTLAGHKGLMGIQGSGALLFSQRVHPTPLMHGGTGSDSFSLDTPDFYPDALEAGTLSFPAVLSLLEGIHYLTLHQAENAQKILSLTSFCIEGLRKLQGFELYSIPNPCGIVAFEKKDVPSEELSFLLSQKGFCVRGGLHCAPLMHKALQTSENGLVRISFSPFNTQGEIEELLSVLKEI